VPNPTPPSGHNLHLASVTQLASSAHGWQTGHQGTQMGQMRKGPIGPEPP
jgi:hypothetical protein